MKKEKERSAVKTLLKVFLIFIIIIFLCAAVILVWQRDNIMSVYKGATASQEDIAAEITDSKQTANDALAEYDTPVLRDFTLEEEEKIRKGELTVEEAMALILGSDEGGSSSAQNSGAQGGQEVSSGEAEGSGSVSDTNSSMVDKNTLVGNAVKKMYSLKAYYIGRLGSLESEMKSEYKALPADKRGKSAISSIVSAHMGEVNSMQAECDSQVNDILVKLKSDLKSIGEDTSIVATLQTQYQNEKNLRKSYYVSTYLN